MAGAIGGPTRPHTCVLCGTSCADRRSLFRHQRESCYTSCPELSICVICDKTFMRPSNLARHMRNQHEEGKIPCGTCGKKLRSDAHAEHIRTQHGLRTTGRSDQKTEERTKAPGNWKTSGGTCNASNLDYPTEYLPQGFEDGELISTVGSSEYKECPLCFEQLNLDRRDSILRHMDGHVKKRSQRQWCDECHVGFIFPEDLEFHLACASSGSCGYSFGPHECTGHHPAPVVSQVEIAHQSTKRPRRQPRDLHTEFVWRVRAWEQDKIEHANRCVAEILQSLKPRFARTSPYAESSLPGKTQTRRTVPARVHYDDQINTSIEDTDRRMAMLSLRSVAG